MFHELRAYALLLVGVFYSSCSYGQDERQLPLEAMVRSVAWSKVLSQDHDVTVTVRYGANEDAPTRGTSIEDVCKSRQIFDSKTGDFWIPYARGTFAIRFDSKNASPMDQRAVGVFVGNKDVSKETSFIGLPTRTIRGVKDILRASNPIDIAFVASNPYSQSLYVDKHEVASLKILLERLEELDASQLRVASEKFENQKVKVYRIKAVPLPESRYIATNRIIVSDEGPDKGLVLEFSRDCMNLGDQSPYEKDSQLLGNERVTHRVRWKKFQIPVVNGSPEGVVLPISIANAYKTAHSPSYMNVTLEWNSFSSPDKSLRTIESSEKIANEFDRQINRALNR